MCPTGRWKLEQGPYVHREARPTHSCDQETNDVEADARHWRLSLESPMDAVVLECLLLNSTHRGNSIFKLNKGLPNYGKNYASKP